MEILRNGFTALGITILVVVLALGFQAFRPDILREWHRLRGTKGREDYLREPGAGKPDKMGAGKYSSGKRPEGSDRL